MTAQSEPARDIDFSALTGRRNGPYQSHNPVSRVQIWQWCSALGDKNPLYLDSEYQNAHGFARAVAPPGMMQMWTMRDVNLEYAPGSTDAPPYEVFDVLATKGFPDNVAVSYDVQFHRLLQEGERAHHYNTIASISELKTTALGQGFFVVEHAEFFNQDEELFAEAFITYFQYKAAGQEAAEARSMALGSGDAPQDKSDWQPDFTDRKFEDLEPGDRLPSLAIPITHKLIVSGAAASQDYIVVHHNAPAAREAGMPDIFMNILTTCGLCARYLTDWSGPGGRLRRLQLKLMAPNVPGDTMTLEGGIKSLDDTGSSPIAEIEFAGKNNSGLHVSGSATMELAR
jgi:acyl dehydratase